MSSCRNKKYKEKRKVVTNYTVYHCHGLTLKKSFSEGCPSWNKIIHFIASRPFNRHLLLRNVFFFSFFPTRLDKMRDQLWFSGRHFLKNEWRQPDTSSLTAYGICIQWCKAHSFLVFKVCFWPGQWWLLTYVGFRYGRTKFVQICKNYKTQGMGIVQRNNGWRYKITYV